MTEKVTRNITIDSVDQFVQRIAEGKPENTGVRGAESTLTAILGRMAMDARREVTWDEMMKGKGSGSAGDRFWSSALGQAAQNDGLPYRSRRSGPLRARFARIPSAIPPR